MLKDKPDLSVVVIGRNEGELLARCLGAISNMSFSGKLEVIYVDSHSSDGSPARAAALGAQVIELDDARPTASKGRNAGWRAARAPFILFLDGDTEVDPQFVANALPCFDDRLKAVVWGHLKEIRPEQSIFNRVLDLDWIFPAGESVSCGGNALMRRSALKETGGFREDLTAGEEPELCLRLRLKGYTIWHADCKMAKHDLNMTSWRQYWLRGTRTGWAYAEVSAMTQALPTPLWRRESQRSVLQGGGYLAALLIAIAAGIFTESFLLPVLFMLSAAIVLVRTAILARHRSRNRNTLLLYAVHSHLIHVPILFGQIAYWRSDVSRPQPPLSCTLRTPEKPAN